MPAYEIDGIVPVVAPEAFVHPTAVLIGDVIIGARCYVGANAVLRGDFGRIVMEPGSNLQDTCVMHSFPACDAVIETDGHVGHGAVLHGCRVGRNAMVGMNAVIMDGAVVGEESIVAAAAFVKAGMTIPPRSLVAGVPGKIIRQVTDEEIRWKIMGTATYHQLTVRSLATMRPVTPLASVEEHRARLGKIEGFDTLFAMKRDGK